MWNGKYDSETQKSLFERTSKERCTSWFQFVNLLKPLELTFGKSRFSRKIVFPLHHITRLCPLPQARDQTQCGVVGLVVLRQRLIDLKLRSNPRLFFWNRGLGLVSPLYLQKPRLCRRLMETRYFYLYARYYPSKPHHNETQLRWSLEFRLWSTIRNANRLTSP